MSGATVWSSGSSEQGTLTQRRRWEGGFLATAIRHGPKEVLFGLTSGDPKRIFAGLDLLVPPLALFAFLNAAALAVAAFATAALDLHWWPIFVQSSLACRCMFYGRSQCTSAWRGVALPASGSEPGADLRASNRDECRNGDGCKGQDNRFAQPECDWRPLH